MSAHFDKVLIHTCTIERATETRTGTGDSKFTFTSLSTNVPCRLVRKLQRFAAERMSRELLDVDMLLVKPAVDIEPGDRVTSFAWRSDGSSYDVGTFEVRTRLKRNIKTAHHTALELEQIDG